MKLEIWDATTCSKFVRIHQPIKLYSGLLVTLEMGLERNGDIGVYMLKVVLSENI